MNVDYFSGASVGPIGGTVTLPAHPPVTGTPVHLGSFRMGQAGGIVTSVLGVPDQPSIMAGIGFAVGSAALLAGSFFFPPGIPYVSGFARVGLLAGGAYLAYRSALHFIHGPEASSAKAKWSAAPPLTRIGPGEELEQLTGVPYRVQIINWSPGEGVTYWPGRRIPIDVLFTHLGYGPDPITLTVRAVMKPVTPGRDWEEVSEPLPVTITSGRNTQETFKIPHPGFWKREQDVHVEIQVCGDFTCFATTRVFTLPLYI